MSNGHEGGGSARGDRAPASAEEKPPRQDTQTGIDVARRLAPGTLVAGRYRILALAGIGGMGVVYRAHDEELGVDVALKVLRPDLGPDPHWLDRFRRELVLARQVTHQNVVRIHDIGESEGLRFLTMGYVEGRSLLAVLQESGQLPLARALRILRQVAEALERAHAAGVVHRDLKPGNILLEADDTAYVSDFGVARSLDRDNLTREGQIVGTPDYLSPEQVSGDPVDARSDLYSLGILFYEMLTGELPFRGDSRAQLLAQRIAGRARDIAETGLQVPSWVRRVIRRCLERSPTRRYQSARELLADLERQASASFRPGWGWLAVPVALAVGAGGWAYRSYFATRQPAAAGPVAAVEVGHSIAVLPLVDETADPSLAWTRTGVAEMLASDLSESTDLRVIDALRVFGSLRDLQLETGRYDEVTLGQLGRLLEVDRLVIGSVRRAGAAVRVDLSLASVGSGAAPSVNRFGAEAPEASGLFRIVARLGEELRRELGAEPPAGEGPAPGTTSVAAAAAYREGSDRLLVGDHVGAAPALERAVEADPGFATALERLSEAYQSLGYDEKALVTAERAARALDARETRLAYRIRARLAALEGDPATAEKLAAEQVRRYPKDLEALLDLAAAQAKQGHVARAVASLTRATELDRADPRAWFLLGKNAILAGDAARAVNDYLVRALTIQNQLRNQQGLGDALNAMGAAYHELGDYGQALEKYSAAAAIRERLSDQRGVAATLKNRARTHVAMGRLAEAEPDLRSARRLFEKIGDRAGLADVLNDFGVLHESRGEYREARRSYQEALKIRRSLGDERQLAQSYDNVGYVFFLEGEYDNALVYWQQALELRRKAGDKGGVVLSIQSLGFLQTAQGRWEQARRSFLEALELSRAIDFKSAMAVSFGNLGLLHQYEGRYGAALHSFQQALGLLKPLDDKRGLAEFTLKEAGALLELGRLDAARGRLETAEGWLRETGNHEQAADRLAMLGEWHARRGERDPALEAFAQARLRADATHSRSAILRVGIAEAWGRAALGDAGAAAAALAVSAREADSLGEAVLRLRAVEGLARADLTLGRLREAEASARRGLSLAERCGWGSGAFRLHALLGRILEKKGDGASAALEYREAARLVAKLREELDAELRGSFDALESVREVEARTSGTTASSGGAGT